MVVSEELVRAALTIGLTKLRPQDPFQWASKYFMPIYNDNRMYLSHPKYRRMIAEGFRDILQHESIPVDVIAGTSTAGISPGTTLADLLELPLMCRRYARHWH
jgi:orotate phosphoribosyltransferase